MRPVARRAGLEVVEKLLLRAWAHMVGFPAALVDQEPPLLHTFWRRSSSIAKAYRLPRRILQLHQLADAVPDRYRALILLSGYGGLRWAELVGLRRRHVDLVGARVQVVEQAAEVAGKSIVSPQRRMPAGGW